MRRFSLILLTGALACGPGEEETIPRSPSSGETESWREEMTDAAVTRPGEGYEQILRSTAGVFTTAAWHHYRPGFFFP